MSKVPKWTLFVLFAVVIWILSQYFHCQVSQPSISSLGASGKVLETKENVANQEIITNGNKEKPRAMNGVPLPTNGGIWHRNYTSKDDDSGKNLVGLWQILNKSYVEEHLDQPQVGDYICEDALCSEFLTEKDLKQVERCADRFIKRQLIREGGQTLVPTCHFINGTSRASNVALISFPGSGNTWTRGLLEKTTGICTGEEHNSHS